MAVSHGRIVEVFAATKVGKCVTADTMLLTERGMVTVKELFEIGRVQSDMHYSRCKEHNVGLINENGVIEKTLTPDMEQPSQIQAY